MSFELTGCLLRIVSNFAADNSNQSHTYVGRLITAGIFDQLERIIEQVKPELIREALWILSNIASECEEFASQFSGSSLFKLVVMCL